MEILVEEWLSHLTGTGRRPHTIESYRIKCTRCLDELRASGRPTDPREITPMDLVYLNGVLRMKESSRRDYLRVFDYWIQWIRGESILSKSEILWNHTEPERVFIQADEFAELLSIADERDRVILLLGGAMGLRCSEILGAKWTDIEEGRLTIRGKGHGPEGKVTTMRIPSVVMDALDQWRTVQANNGMEDLSDGRIIVSYQKAGMKAMVRTSLSHHIKRLGERAGVRVTTHSLRRLFATSLYRAEVDIVDIKTLMRHANVATTINCYIQPSADRLDGILENISSVLNI